jgi:transcription-repair coupling factor (superfamily II helicase)
VRVGVYRRIARLSDRREIDGFVAEMIDRFDPLPAEVENLLEIAIERDCREARTEKLGTGPNGAVISLRDNRSPIPPASST